jgi:hypothetical protein
LIRPSVGAAVDYTRRNYSGLQSPYGSVVGPYGTGIGNETSDAFDVGLLAAADIAVGGNFTIGLEYRYMMNMTYWYEGQNVLNTAAYQNANGTVTPLEATNYDIWSIVFKYTF